MGKRIATVRRARIDQEITGHRGAVTEQAMKLVAFLRSGRDITEGQARTRFGIKSINRVVTEAARQGYAVYGNEARMKNGRHAVLYRLGTPRREVVAAGFAALGLA